MSLGKLPTDFANRRIRMCQMSLGSLAPPKGGVWPLPSDAAQTNLPRAVLSDAANRASSPASTTGSSPLMRIGATATVPSICIVGAGSAGTSGRSQG